MTPARVQWSRESGDACRELGTGEGAGVRLGEKDVCGLAWGGWGLAGGGRGALAWGLWL
jgi:hypothetical protein